MHTEAGIALILPRLFSGLLMVALCLAGPVRADVDAEAYARNTIHEGLAILREAPPGDAAREARFHAFIIDRVDARKTALFALGPWRRGASQAALDRYIAAFQDYVVELYETRLEKYHDMVVEVTGSVQNRPGDVTVETLGAAAGIRDRVRIAFRLSGSSSAYKVIDIQVEGVWLSVELRDQFGSLLGASEGDVGALAATLESRTANMRAHTAGQPAHP